MSFTVEKSIEILQRTPEVLYTLLHNISADWTCSNEGGDTWSVYDIVGHLIHGEKTDWVPRAAIILSQVPDKTFQPFDRFAQLQESEGKSLTGLLAEFTSLRKKNIEFIVSKRLTDENLQEKGIHPA